ICLQIQNKKNFHESRRKTVFTFKKILNSNFLWENLLYTMLLKTHVSLDFFYRLLIVSLEYIFIAINCNGMPLIVTQVLEVLTVSHLDCVFQLLVFWIMYTGNNEHIDLAIKTIQNGKNNIIFVTPWILLILLDLFTLILIAFVIEMDECAPEIFFLVLLEMMRSFYIFTIGRQDEPEAEDGVDEKVVCSGPPSSQIIFTFFMFFSVELH
ncbi:hypothetical protein ACJX0J_008143, partial [Zea mays]